MRNSETASGSTRSRTRSPTPSLSALTSIAGSVAREDWVETATTWVGAIAATKA